jgi:hypothetical protein
VFRQHLEQRNQDLIKAGHNFGRGYRLGKNDKVKQHRSEFIVPPGEEEQQLLFWVETSGADVTFRLFGPDRKEIVAWSGHQGEQLVVRQLRVGRHCLEIDSAGVEVGSALFSMKGHIIAVADLDPQYFHEYPAVPEEDFYWPYLLFLPKQIKYPCLLVVPNNTGFASEDIDLLRAAASGDIERESALAGRLGCPLLVPIFPRPPAKENGNLYLHALSRESMLTTVEAWKRVDLQLLQMVRNAQIHLEARGIKSGDKVLLWGFSAAGSFVNRFAMLHPDHVLAVAGGGIGWPIVPLAEIEHEGLRYPIGIADLDTFTGAPVDLAALRSVKWFLFRGGDDANDPVDYRDCYAEADAEIIRHRFGSAPAVRWLAAQRLYAEAQLKAQLVLYPGLGHSWTPEIREAGFEVDDVGGLDAALKRNSAMSPTTFAEGVTLTMSPKSWLTSA